MCIRDRISYFCMEKNVCKMTDDSIFLIDIEKILKTKACLLYTSDPSNSMYPGKPVLHRFHKGKPDTLMAHAVISVSYTHLDVYKRQG